MVTRSARRLNQTVLLVFAIVLITVKANPTEDISANASTTTATPSSSTTSSTSTEIPDKGRAYTSGDEYIDSANKDCLQIRDMTTCVKYRALKYVHEIASPFEETGRRRSFRYSEYSLGGSIKLVALPPQEVAPAGDPLFPESRPRASDNEIMKLFRFTLREAERFVRSYALTINVPKAVASGRADNIATPRFIDEDFFSDISKQVASRDKKKTLLFLLPLVSFFHLKALLVPILLAVLFIKKLLVLGVIFLPSLLSLVKWCKPMHHHHLPWYSEPEPPMDYHSEYAPHYDSYKTSHGGHKVNHGAQAHQSWSASKRYPQATSYSYRHEGVPPPQEPSSQQAWGESRHAPIVLVTPNQGSDVTPSSRSDSAYGIDDDRWDLERHPDPRQVWEQARWSQEQYREVGRGYNRESARNSNTNYRWNSRPSTSGRERDTRDKEASYSSMSESVENASSWPEYRTSKHYVPNNIPSKQYLSHDTPKQTVNKVIKADIPADISQKSTEYNTQQYDRESYQKIDKKKKCDYDHDHQSDQDVESSVDTVTPAIQSQDSNPEISSNYSVYSSHNES